MSLFNSGLHYVRSLINLKNKQEELRRAKETSKVYYHQEEQFFDWISNYTDGSEETEYLETFYKLSQFAKKHKMVETSLFEGLDSDRLTDLRVKIDLDRNAKQFFDHNLSTVYSLLHLLKKYIEAVEITTKPGELKKASEAHSLSKVQENLLDEGNRILDFERIGDVEFTKPISLTYRGNLYQCGHWGQALAQLCNCISEDYPEVIDRFRIYENSKIPWIVDENQMNLLHNPKKIKEDYYIDTCRSANNMAYQMQCLLDTAGIEYADVVLRYRDSNKQKREENKQLDKEVLNRVENSSEIRREKNRGIKVFEEGIKEYSLPEKQREIEEDSSLKKYVCFEKNQNLDYTKPISLNYRDESFYTDYWNSLFSQACTYLIQDYPEVFKRLRDRGVRFGNKQWIVSHDLVSALIAPKKIADDYYVETGRKTNQLIANLRYLLDECKVPYEDMVIRYSAETSRKEEKPAEDRENESNEELPGLFEAESEKAWDSLTSPIHAGKESENELNFFKVLEEAQDNLTYPAKAQEGFKDELDFFETLEEEKDSGAKLPEDDLKDLQDGLESEGKASVSYSELEQNSDKKTINCKQENPLEIDFNQINATEIIGSEPVSMTYKGIRFSFSSWQPLLTKSFFLLYQDFPQAFTYLIDQSLPTLVKFRRLVETRSVFGSLMNIKRILDGNSIPYNTIRIQFKSRSQVSESSHAKENLSQFTGERRLLQKNDSVTIESSPSEQECFEETNPKPMKDDRVTYEITLNEVNENFEPIAFSYFGDKQEAGSWAEAYELAYEELMEDYDTKIKYLADNQDDQISMRTYAWVKEHQMVRPVEVERGYFIDLYRTPIQIIQELKYLMDTCNADQENIVFECVETKKEPNPFFKWLNSKVLPAEKTRLLFIYQDVEKQARTDQLIRDNLCETIDPLLYKRIKYCIERNRIFKFRHKGEYNAVEKFFQYLLQFSYESIS